MKRVSRAAKAVEPQSDVPASGVPIDTPQRIEFLPVAKVSESKSNPRKSFGDMTELVESVRTKGVLVPVLCRPSTDGWELVFGARRLRAAQSAGLAEIPAMVRDMTDREVLEVQVIENLQRADVHPLEEAEGFKALHEQYGVAVEELAAKTGKSVAFVRNRLKLCSLHPSAKEAFFSETINASVAQLLARMPEQVQERATSELLNFPNGGEPVSHRRALDFIQSRYMLSLTEAPFDVTDATLHPDAGACSTCPKRTGNQRELFSDVASEDICTDPDCFAQKKERVWQLRVERAKEAGQEVLAAKEAKKVFLYAGEVSPQSGFVKLEDVCEADPKGRTWHKLLGKNVPTVTIARDGQGNVHELVALDDAAKALKTAGRSFKVPKPPAARNPDDYRREQERQAKARALRAAVAREALDVIVAKVEKQQPGKGLWRFMVETLLPFSSDAREHRFSGVADGELPKCVRRLNEGELRGFVFELAMEHALLQTWAGYTKELTTACKLFGVNLKSVEAKVRTALSGAERANEVKKTSAAPSTPIAQEG
jgi:ParB/RepB/Spo0J family partition protein